MLSSQFHSVWGGWIYMCEYHFDIIKLMLIQYQTQANLLTWGMC